MEEIGKVKLERRPRLVRTPFVVICEARMCHLEKPIDGAAAAP
jgi:hypothetical protein